MGGWLEAVAHCYRPASQGRLDHISLAQVKIQTENLKYGFYWMHFFCTIIKSENFKSNHPKSGIICIHAKKLDILTLSCQWYNSVETSNKHLDIWKFKGRSCATDMYLEVTNTEMVVMGGSVPFPHYLLILISVPFPKTEQYWENKLYRSSIFLPHFFPRETWWAFWLIKVEYKNRHAKLNPLQGSLSFGIWLCSAYPWVRPKSTIRRMSGDHSSTAFVVRAWIWLGRCFSGLQTYSLAHIGIQVIGSLILVQNQPCYPWLSITQKQPHFSQDHENKLYCWKRPEIDLTK